MANHLYGYNPSNYGSGGGASSFPSLYSPKSGADAYNPSDSSLYGASRVLGPNPERGSSMFSQSDILRYGGADIGGSYPMGLAGRVSGASHLTSQSSWPGIDGGAHDPLGAGIKRPPESLYHQTLLGTHNMIGQIEAWFSSNPLAKRPRFESGSTLPIYPQRPGEKDCAHYMLTRTCKFADTCKFDHPIWVPEGGITDWKEVPLVPLAETLPERPGEPDCPYFLKTQKCKFGFKCKFNHPKEQMVTAEVQEGTVFSALPERPSEPPCAFGTSCKFHHPKDIQQPSAGQDYATDGQSESAPGNDETIGLVQQAKPNFAPASLHNSKGLPIRPAHTELSISREEFEKLKEEFKVTKEHMVQYKSIAQVNEAALKQMETSHENFKNEADKVRTSLEAEISSYRERVKELEIECSLKSKEAASAVANTESSIASAVSEIDLLKEELSVKKSEIEAAETQISLLTKDLEEEHKKWRDAQTNYERQADKVRTSLEAEISSYRERVKELEIECSLKSKEAASAVANTESSIASAVSEIDLLKEELSVKKSEIEAAETQISLLTKDLEKEHKKWRDAQTNYERQGEVECPFYLKTGTCKYGATCRYSHPDRYGINQPANAVIPSLFPSPAAHLSHGFVNPAASILQTIDPRLAQTPFGLTPTMYPQRPGQIECDYYMKSGKCLFAERCKYHHPIDRSASTLATNGGQEQNVKLSLAGLPRREGATHCPFYMKTGTCKYGVNCKFDHPPPAEVRAMATSAATAAAAAEGEEKAETQVQVQEQQQQQQQ